jgi:hypothetical protein
MAPQGDQLTGTSCDPRLTAWIAGRTDLIAHIEGYKLAADVLYARLRQQPLVLGMANLFSRAFPNAIRRKLNARSSSAAEAVLKPQCSTSTLSSPSTTYDRLSLTSRWKDSTAT